MSLDKKPSRMNMRRIAAIASTALLAGSLALAAPVAAGAAQPGNAPAAQESKHRQSAEQTDTRRLVMYYQTQYHQGKYVSPMAMVQRQTGLTDLIVGAIHVNETPGEIRLNDDLPSDAKFNKMWDELDDMQDSGVDVIGMLGGAARGTFERLDLGSFDTYYPHLRNMVEKYDLDGLDLDVEEDMSLPGVINLIDHLKADFGDGFIITLAPVATALKGGTSISGFNYDELYAARGADIEWFNTQFYCGWGSLETTAGYDAIMDYGVYPAEKVVAGTLTDPSLCNRGFVEVDKLAKTVNELSKKYPGFGGVMGWEYFTSQPGGLKHPWKWAKIITQAMR